MALFRSGSGSGGSIGQSSFYDANFSSANIYTFTKDYQLVIAIVYSGSDQSSVMKIDNVASTETDFYSAQNATVAIFRDVKKDQVFGPYGFGSSWPTRIIMFE